MASSITDGGWAGAYRRGDCQVSFAGHSKLGITGLNSPVIAGIVPITLGAFTPVVSGEDCKAGLRCEATAVEQDSH